MKLNLDDTFVRDNVQNITNGLHDANCLVVREHSESIWHHVKKLDLTTAEFKKSFKQLQQPKDNDLRLAIGMLNGSRKTGNRFLIRWPVCKVRNRLLKSFISVLCIYILIILINDFYCLRVSADTDAPAAITINSNMTHRLKNMVRVSAWTEVATNEAGISIHVPPAVQTAGVTWVDIKRTPPPCTLRGASITDTRGKCMPACQRDRPAVEVWLCE